MIIDAHCHIGNGCRYKVSPDDLLALMDANGVAKAIVVPVDQFIAVYNREGNDFVLNESRKRPDRFYPMITANPWFGDAAKDEVRRAFNEGAVGLKLHPSIQGFKITDEIVHPLVEVASEYGKPIYFHTGTLVSSEPYQLAELALQYPEVSFIMGHSAFSDYWNDVLASAKVAPNLFMETSIHWPSFISDVVDEIGSHRILFGSDIPKNAMDLEIEKIQRYIKDERDRDNIFFLTAQKIFKELADGH